MRALAREIDGLELPAVEKISKARQEDPFQVLIATLLSARTQDATTAAASTRLFGAARTPQTMATLSVKRIERLIYPVSFYRNKARHVKATCRMLVERFGGRVPGDHGGTADAARRGPQDRQPRADPRVQERARTSAWTPTSTGFRIVSDGCRRRRPTRRSRPSMRRPTGVVAVDQPLSRHLGTKRLPSRLSAMRRVRDRASGARR